MQAIYHKMKKNKCSCKNEAITEYYGIVENNSVEWIFHSSRCLD